MPESKRRILQMLADGKISVEEAAALLRRMGEIRRETESSGSAAPPNRPRFIRVVVHSHEGDKVNVRIPLSLIRTGIKLKALIPREASAAMSEQGFDLSGISSLDDEELMAALADLKVEVDSSDGDTVRVFAE